MRDALSQMDAELQRAVAEATGDAERALAQYTQRCQQLITPNVRVWAATLQCRLAAMTLSDVVQGALRAAVRDARAFRASRPPAEAVHINAVLFILSRAARAGEDLTAPSHGWPHGKDSGAEGAVSVSESLVGSPHSSAGTHSPSAKVSVSMSPAQTYGVDDERDMAALNSSFSSAMGLSPQHSPSTPSDKGLARRFLAPPASHGSHTSHGSSTAMNDAFKTPSPVASILPRGTGAAAAVAGATATATSSDPSNSTVAQNHRSYRGMLVDTMLATPAISRLGKKRDGKKQAYGG